MIIRLTFVFLLLSAFAFESFGFFVRDASHDNDANDARANVLMSNTDLGTSVRTALFTEGKNSAVSASAVKVYVPAKSVNNERFSYYRNTNNGDYLVEINGTSTNGFLRFTLDLEVTGVDDKLFFGVLNSTGNYTMSILDSSAVTVEGSTVDINMDLLCSQPSVLACSSFDATSTATTTSPASIKIAFFLHDNAGESELAESDIENGAFYEVSIGNRVNDLDVVLNTLALGDEQLFVNYTGFVLQDIEGVYAVADSTDCVDRDTPVNQALGDINIGRSGLIDLESVNQSGTLRVKGLENNQCYGIRVVLCDKYGFCSEVSNQKEGTPESIQSLLTKNGCFFFTAGFGGNHYIIDYFRVFRDEVLRESSLGNLFVDFYYQVGPKYAPWLLDKPWAQKSVRFVAHVLYGFLRYFQTILFIIVGLLAVVIMRKLRGVVGYGRS